MNKIELKYVVKELTFKQAIYTSQTTWFKRQVVFVAIRIDDYIGYGEIAPLPGWGSESLEQSIAVLNSLRIENLIKKTPDSITEIIEFSNYFSSYFPYAYATRCGLEMALLDIYIKIKDINVHNLFGTKIIDKIPVAALVSGKDFEEIYKEIETCYKLGYRTVKIKADNQTINSMRYLFKIKATFPNLKVRLDFNGCLNKDELFEFFDAAYNLVPEYIEQPLSSGSERKMYKVIGNFIIPTALDESIKSPESAYFYLDYPEFIQILKPMTFGGHLWVAHFLAYAQQKKVQVVLSSAMESSLTGWYNVLLAATMNTTVAQGFGTYSMIENDFCVNPVKVVNGCINLSDVSKKTLEIVDNLKRELF